MKNKKIIINSNMYFLIFVVAIITKYFQYNFLSDKYFFDSKHILNIMNFGLMADMSYIYTANFFNTVNIFNLSTLLHWSIFLSVIGNVFLFFIFIKNKNTDIGVYIFIMANIILLNIYVFNLSKDILQFFIFNLIYFIINNKKLNNFSKIFFCAMMFLVESMFFRSYYILIGLMIFPIYYFLNKNCKLDRKNKLRYEVKTFINIFLFLFLIIFILQYISSENYNDVIYARESLNNYRMDSPNARTMIHNLISNNGTYPIFILNYIINILRLMFPLELIGKGALAYYPFVVFQLFVFKIIFDSLKMRKKENIIVLSVLLAYFITSALFEPDYGSALRHESTLILLFYKLLINKKQEKCNKEKEN